MAEVMSIVIGSGPGSSVRHCLDGGWSREAHLLANMQEGNAGLANLREPYARPGLAQRPTEKKQDICHGDAMTWEELDAREQAVAAAAAKGGKRNTRKAVW